MQKTEANQILKRWHLEILLAIVVLLPFLYLVFSETLFLDLTNDEVYSLRHFALVSPGVTVSDYHFPNNHIFFNFLNNLYLRVIGIDSVYDLLGQVQLIRLLMLFYTLVCFVYVYLLAKKLGGIVSGLLGLVLLATTLPFYNFSLQVRGYMLSTLLAVMVVYYAWSYERSSKLLPAVLLGMTSGLLLYTLPSNIYFLASVGVFYFVAGIFHWLKPDSLSFLQESGGEQSAGKPWAWLQRKFEKFLQTGWFAFISQGAISLVLGLAIARSVYGNLQLHRLATMIKLVFVSGLTALVGAAVYWLLFKWKRVNLGRYSGKQKVALCGFSLGTGLFLWAIIQLSPLPFSASIPARNHVIEITALAEKSPYSEGAQVRFLEMRAGDGEKVPWDAMEIGNGWQPGEIGLVFEGEEQATVRYTFTGYEGQNFTALMSAHDGAGIARFVLDGYERTVDFYESNAGDIEVGLPVARNWRMMAMVYGADVLLLAFIVFLVTACYFSQPVTNLVERLLTVPQLRVVGILSLGTVVGALCYVPVLNQLMFFSTNMGERSISLLTEMLPEVLWYFVSGRELLLGLFVLGVLLLLIPARSAWRLQKRYHKWQYYGLFLAAVSFLPFVIAYLHGTLPFQRNFVVLAPFVILLLALLGVVNLIEIQQPSWRYFIFAAFLVVVGYSYLMFEKSLEERDNAMLQIIETGNQTNEVPDIFYVHQQSYYHPFEVLTQYAAHGYSSTIPVVVYDWGDPQAIPLYVYDVLGGFTKIATVEEMPRETGEIHVITARPYAVMDEIEETYDDMVCSLLNAELDYINILDCVFE